MVRIHFDVSGGKHGENNIWTLERQRATDSAEVTGGW